LSATEKIKEPGRSALKHFGRFTYAASSLFKLLALFRPYQSIHNCF
jgi:hypothetical protein